MYRFHPLESSIHHYPTPYIPNLGLKVSSTGYEALAFPGSAALIYT